VGKDLSNQSAIILKTTDGGWNWISQISGIFGNLTSVYFVASNTGWVVGQEVSNQSTRILKTTDGGTNWTSQTSGTTALLRSVYFTDNNTGWVVGNSGTILKTTTGGVTFIEEQEINEIPAAYSVTQNFPNPFNPTTKITFSIPELSFITLKVFDVLGNEIITLFNEEKPAGTYEVEFDGSELTSGIYFYQLQAGSFVKTKKMVLMK